MRARKSRVKLCAVGMRNAILGNDLNIISALTTKQLMRIKKVIVT